MSDAISIEARADAGGADAFLPTLYEVRGDGRALSVRSLRP